MATKGAGGRARPLLVGVAWVATVAVALGAGWLAADATLRPPDVEAEAAGPALYTVVEGTVGRTVPATAAAAWERTLVATQSASGTVTAVRVTPGEALGVGDVLFTVDERPVVLAVGDVPAYRDMARGAAGDDVAQLQRFLADGGFFAGDADGRFGPATERAVRDWQREIGVADDGRVRRGDVLFVGELPARVLLDEAIAVGRQVSPGGDAVWSLAAEPTFQISLSPGQRDLVPLDAGVRVEYPGGAWDADIASAETDAQDFVVLTLAGVGGGAVCGDDCVTAVPPGSERQYRARIVAVPETTGPLVPAAALRTDPSGRVEVTVESGERRQVEVLAADAGRAVVDGLPVGTVLRLFGDADAQAGDPPAAPPPASPETDEDPGEDPGDAREGGTGGDTEPSDGGDADAQP